MEKDYSEYQPTEYEKYRLSRQGRAYIDLNLFHNTVRFDRNRRDMEISVDPCHEYAILLDDLRESDWIETEGHPLPLYRNEEERLQYCKQVEEQNLENKLTFARFLTRFQINRHHFDQDVRDIYAENPDVQKEPLNNVLSGAEICLSVGEGLLDFLYADFEKPYRNQIEFIALLKQFVAAGRDENEGREIKEAQRQPTTPVKIRKQSQTVAERFYQYEDTMTHARALTYASLYSAICPPLFRDGGMHEKALRYYYAYLRSVQKEYLERIEFCFDEEYRPEMLGGLDASARYCLYRHIKGWPSFFKQQDEVYFARTVTQEDIKRHFSGQIFRPVGISQETVDTFCAEFGIEPDYMKYFFATDHTLFRRTEFCTPADILELEFDKLIEIGARFRKCRRCGRYFLMKGNYDTNYCDTPAAGETKSCQELAAQENYKKRMEADEALPIYNKYYKRYSARVKVRQIKEADFKRWRYEAMQKRDACSRGEITPEELVEWMEAAFPNRKKREE